MGRKHLAKAVELLNSGTRTIVMGLWKSGIEDKLSDMRIREVNASAKTGYSCPGRNENRLSEPIPAVILLVRRNLNTYFLEKVYLAFRCPVQV